MGAQTKAKKGGSKSKQKTKEKINPFELKFNRIKHNVLGKKKGSVGVGHPGLSRKRAYQHREQTLGVEHDRLGKVNKIIDRRIGEKNSELTTEEKASQRFTAERVKNFKKANKFNLTDDYDKVDEEDTLTHGGKSLTAIQKYDRTMLSDDEDDEDGDIAASVVKVAHFGGGAGAFTRPADFAEKSSRKDLIADLIARTKQVRKDKQDAINEQETITNNLDEKLDKLMGKVRDTFRPVGANKEDIVVKDNYDNLVHGFKVEGDKRATATDRKKTDEEEAADERERLQELENQRVARMNAQTNKRGHLSADADIDEVYDDGKKKKTDANPFVVRFDEHGQMYDKDEVEKSTIRKVAIDSDDELSDEVDEDEEEEDIDDMLNRDEEEEEGEDGDDDGDDDEEDEEKEMIPAKKTTKVAMTANKVKVSTKKDEEDNIPFVFEMPKDYKKFRATIRTYPMDKLGIIIERIIKCHHPRLAPGNKKNLSKMFLFLLRYFDELAQQTPSKEHVNTLGIAIKSLYTLSKFDVDFGARCVRALLRQNWRLRVEKKKRAAPTFAVVALLRLVSSLYPTSDVWHPVCTPTMTLAAATLGDCQITSLSVLARQILIATTVGDFVEESKRYVPEAMAFLRGSLMMSIETLDSERAPSTAFPLSQPHRSLLYIRENIQKASIVEPLDIAVIFDQNNTNALEDTDMNRCRVLRSLIAIVQKFRLLYVVHESTFSASFAPLVQILHRIPTYRLPTVLAEEVDALAKSMDAECKKKASVVQLCQVKTELSMMKMLEPVIEENFDPDRPRMGRDMNRQGKSAENKKMQYLHKKEMRSAIKEIRKDNTFLGRKKRREVQERDRDRRQKTKRIYSGLQDQQGDWNREKRENQKEKREYSKYKK